jgi:iron complex transport system ATP-binding protein
VLRTIASVRFAAQPRATGEVALRNHPILHDLSLTVRPGELVAICGPNGAGKTTLLRALAGLLPGMPPRDPRRVAYLPQGARCAWGLTVAQVAALGRIPHRDSAAAPVTLALQRCGILALRDRRVDRISGGEARRAMLARAFATEPDLFLLDEPTADLDPAAAHAVMRLLRQTADAGRAVVVVQHAIDLAVRFAHRMVVLQAGRITADLPARDALPAAAAAFGLPFGLDPEPRLLPPDDRIAPP